MAGKLIRLGSWLHAGRTFLVALDTTIPRGLHPALAALDSTLSWLTSGEVDGLVLHAGVATRYAERLAGGCPWLMKLTTNSSLVPDRTVRGSIGSVEQALTLGASGVAINVFIGSAHEREHLRHLSDVVIEGAHWGMPVVAFINPPEVDMFDAGALAYACRIGAELGADVIKTDFSGDQDSFAHVVAQCPVPVLVEESPLPMTPEGSRATALGAVQAGGAGVLFGERIWAESAGRQLAHDIRSIVHADGFRSMKRRHAGGTEPNIHR